MTLDEALAVATAARPRTDLPFDVQLALDVLAGHALGVCNHTWQLRDINGAEIRCNRPNHLADNRHEFRDPFGTALITWEML